MSSKTTVWSRTHDSTSSEEMPRRLFYFTIGGISAWGFFLATIVSAYTATWQLKGYELMLFGLILPFLGLFISARSGSALLSLVGYHLIVVPLAALLGPGLASFEIADPGIVSSVAFLTGAVTLVMATSGLLYPNFYRSIGGFLFAGIFGLLTVLVAGLFVPAVREFAPIHYFAAGLFALYIGWDMWRASELPPTLNNAVDVSVALYLDILNLFLHMLSILGVGGKD
ncbi:MAG: hypothetical protein A3D67_02745 [Candidatus Lloydbacteria bacterium RIFCSPHIGHO2_02_FULL_51_22]|uniref:Uncharacterized protein n=1 Tax=Candidatus Lloydbacteria bacterium RIFCSPHIGHO2_02_FULL_51_22 TaxID=1798663 RepID=A0A1G2DB64_9BACT|nr:MAG: hypothetical protein A3D67_02745 [Candidatus Lloydbacteria bacterium RIFCSPHIGHO2_02_FULL_51_22]